MSFQPYKKQEALENFRELLFFAPDLIDFTSNFYLGKKTHSTEKITTGSGGSRLLIDNSPYNKFEKWIADLLGFSTALVFQSGYNANLSLFSIFEKNTLIIHDSFIHASIRDGIRLSTARRKSFLHNDLDDLKNILTENHTRFEHIVVVVEAIYSMDGDVAPLDEITALLSDFPNAKLIVDEAHSFGITGKNGLGLIANTSYSSKIWANVVTFSKAIGYQGAVVLMDEDLKKSIINFSRPFIYTTAMPAYSLKIIRERILYFLGNRQHFDVLQENIAFFMDSVSLPNFSKNKSPIQYFLAENSLLEKITETALEKKLLLRAVRYPTVPKGKERIRICLRADHKKTDISILVDFLEKKLFL